MGDVLTRLTRWLSLGIAWAVLTCAVAHAEARFALVVGNSNYVAVTPLDNAVQDAQAMAGTLESLGFSVTLLQDADQITFNQAIARFGRDLRNGGPETTGLFYYAGHGVQWQGVNYMLPVDADLQVAADLSLVALPAASVLQQMNSANNDTNIMILDACRNNPFEGVADLSDNGLAEMKAPTGTFLAYSTAPGAVALDGVGGTSGSPFTAALSTLMTRPGVPIEQLFREVRVKVLEATAGMQTPWDTSSLTSEFFFQAAPEIPEEQRAETELWESVRATRDPVQLVFFIQRYPDGPYIDEASALLGEMLGRGLAPVSGPEPTPEPAPTTPDPAKLAEESALIEAARTSGLAADYQAYLDAFPTGVYSELAKTELEIIAAAPPTPAPAPAPVAPPVVAGPDPAAEEKLLAGLTFVTPFPVGEEVKGRSLSQILATGTPLYPPIEGIPETLWKGQSCSNCHQWTRDALCVQAKNYMLENAERALAKPHPLGHSFKQGLKEWAVGDCP